MRSITLIVLSFFLLICPVFFQTASAQWPQSVPYRVDISVSGFARVEYIGTVSLEITVKDESYDAYDQYGIPHIIYLTAAVVSEDRVGWSAAVSPSALVNTAPGNTYKATLTISAGVAIRNPIAVVNITAKIEGWDIAYDYANVFVMVNSTPRFLAMPLDPPATIPPYSTATYRIQVTNYNVYPQKFRLWTESERGWHSEATSSLSIPPLESEYAYVTIIAPDGFYHRGDSSLVQLFIEPEGEPSYRQMIPLSVTVRGFYLSPWFWYVILPILIVSFLLFGAGMMVSVERERREYETVCGPKPKLSALADEERKQLERIKMENPELYKTMMKKRYMEYQLRLKRYETCIRLQKQKKAVLAEKKKEEKRLEKERKREEKEKKKVEKELEEKKRQIEREKERLRKIEEEKRLKEEAERKKKLEKELAEKKKKIEKLEAIKKKEEEKRRMALEKEIERKRKVLKKAEGKE